MFAGVYFAADYLKTLGLAQILPVVGYFGAVVLTFITTVIKINETFSGSEDSEFFIVHAVFFCGTGICHVYHDVFE